LTWRGSTSPDRRTRTGCEEGRATMRVSILAFLKAPMPCAVCPRKVFGRDAGGRGGNSVNGVTEAMGLPVREGGTT
jgi:hypothetical protein